MLWINSPLSIIDINKFPTTRYQGSKRKLLPWLHKNIAPLKFESTLDVFGGTATVSYLFKKMGKQVHFNDYLKCNYFTGKALIENNNIVLTDDDINFLISKHKTIAYSKFVQKTFEGIYYTTEENKWIDIFLGNWLNLAKMYPRRTASIKQALAFTAFSQSALKKRPFNLFHRANLNIRTRRVKRTFGNKTSWEGSFETYFANFARELNDAVFDNSKANDASSKMASELKNNKPDLIYIDPPYIRQGVSRTEVDYMRFYHFLEGAADPLHWEQRIDFKSKNLHLIQKKTNDWIDPSKNRSAFENLFSLYKDSTIVISYKEPGIPSKRELINSLKKFKTKVISIPGIKYDYALNKNNGYHKEYLLIGVEE